jgi:multiple sugar transport system ATP-binding protein
MIAGLEEISSGDLYIDDKLVNDIEPKDRDIAMVFQSYALYPHMSVYDNMSFALKLQKMDKNEIDKRVKNAAEILGLTEYLKRKPKALSGGQRQRVALGRAIVRNARVFLMDEPLSNLDAKLRVQMRSEIIKLHERVNATTVYVTHDQTEAMTMATRIVVMKDGYIQQIGTPKEIYNNPANLFVAGFIGAPATNFLKGTYSDCCFNLGEHKIEIPESMQKQMQDYDGKEVIMGVRPEDVYCDNIVADTYPSAQFDFNVDISELLGHESILHGTIQDQTLVAKVATRLGVESHSTIKVTFDLGKVHFFDPESTNKII